ncbi:CD63 antigen [Chelonus insularis]|uniref:CD63 antigen n=1 Tax=Chelonus insularis TaxID=460826 RepID=UPI00158C3136|nr:CD63 antigen [Chelonus insularis]
MATTQLDIGLRCIKYLLCAVNSLFVLTGVMIISVGMTIYTVYDDFRDFLDSSYASPAILLVVVGVLTFIIAFFGCCGAIKESTCMVLTFAVMLSIVLLLETAAAISAYAYRDYIRELVIDKIQTTMLMYKTSPEAARAVDLMQSRLQCCGCFDKSEWIQIGFTQMDNLYPDSCYASTFNPSGMSDYLFVYNRGCWERFSMIINQSVISLGTGAIAIALIQFTGIMFAVTLGKAIRRQKTEREKRRWEFRESLVNGYKPLEKTDPSVTFPVVYMQSEPTKMSSVN